MWVYGNLTVGKIEGYKHDMISDKHEIYIINPETVGQYTGLTDKNGKKIFEGDIVKDDVGRIMEVVFREKFAKFSFKLIKITGAKWTCNFAFADMIDWFNCGDFPEVIGNIHDNPELLTRE